MYRTNTILDEGIYGSTQDEFIELLTIGSASSPLQQFLLNSLNEQGLRRMQKSFEVTCGEMQSLIMEKLHRAGEILFYRLSELLSLSKWYITLPKR